MIRTLHLGTLLVALLAMGCTDDIIGQWEARKKDDAGNRNKMDIEEDLTGDATLYFIVNGTEYLERDFDIEWENVGDDQYDLKWECDGDCKAFDFDMECDMSDDGLELDCDGDGGWKEYRFDWEKDE